MTVCSFFLQGRCRYGEKCWNEHPRGASGSGGGGGGGGGYGSYNNRTPQPNNNRGGGGFGNKVWVNPSQRSSGRDFVQPSSFSKGGGSDWGRGVAAGGRDSKSSNFSFSTQNRFSSLNTQQAYDTGGRGDDNDKHLETIQKDMETWESSGQWPFSCYSLLKAPISGFSEVSAEEFRHEYYKCRAAGDLQNYAQSVQQLLNQWRSRVQELRILNSSTRVKLIAELNNPTSQSTSIGFSSTTSNFGTGGFGADGSSFGSGGSGFGGLDNAASSSSFSFAAGSTGFGSAAASGGFSSANTQVPAGFGSAGPSQPAGPFGSSSSSFGGSVTPSATSFSFTTASARKDPTASTVSASDFSFSPFGVPLAVTPATGGDSFGQPVSVPSGAGSATGGAPDKLFTPKSELTPEELKEFSGKRFTLGQIPLRPPPADLLVV